MRAEQHIKKNLPWLDKAIRAIEAHVPNTPARDRRYVLGALVALTISLCANMNLDAVSILRAVADDIEKERKRRGAN
jgi:hypothetical protein